MADDRDQAQQTEEPTQKRLDEAHEHGDVVKSSEVQTLVLLLGGTLAIAMFGTVRRAGAGQHLPHVPGRARPDGHRLRAS